MSKQQISIEAIVLLNDLLHIRLSQGTTPEEFELAQQSNLFLKRELHKRREIDFTKKYTKEQEALGRRYMRWQLRVESIRIFRKKNPRP